MAEHDGGPSARNLEEGRLLKELEAIHRTRHETLLHGSDDALVTHTQRMNELEHEYVRRHPQRAKIPGRTRSGARARSGDEAGRTGAGRTEAARTVPGAHAHGGGEPPTG